MKVGDIVIGGHNYFRITGIYLGGVGTQNLVGLESLGRFTGYANGIPVKEMLPEELVITAGVYRRVDCFETTIRKSHSFNEWLFTALI